MKKHSLLNIHHHYKSLPVPVTMLRNVADKIYTEEKIPATRHVDLVLCSDYYIKKLNSSYRKKNYATDVLSFPFSDNDLLGEIYISLQRAKVQARRFKISYEDEIVRLFVHGMFHLIGFDHMTIPDRDRMEKKEQHYFSITFLDKPKTK